MEATDCRSTMSVSVSGAAGGLRRNRRLPSASTDRSWAISFGGLALAIDYAELSRQRQTTLNALDAAAVATGAHIVSGSVSSADPAAYEVAIKKYAQDFFEANLGPVDPSKTTLAIVLPTNKAGGGTLQLSATLNYKPYFLPTFAELIGRPHPGTVEVAAKSEVRLKNTLDVALVLDNSGSMDFLGGGSGKKRLDLLKDAAKQLVDKLAAQGAMMKQVNAPVQFSVVPFAASVNVGPENANASWMDTTALSPVHYENFDKPFAGVTSITLATNKKIECLGGVCYKKGTAWPTAEQNQPITRFTLFNDLKITTSSGTKAFTTWAGCVEARPSPYNNDNTTPSKTTPATLFVPMFAPDETDNTEGSYSKTGVQQLVERQHGQHQQSGPSARAVKVLHRRAVGHEHDGRRRRAERQLYDKGDHAVDRCHAFRRASHNQDGYRRHDCERRDQRA
jgi:Flp pilus assembly protein TadG